MFVSICDAERSEPNPDPHFVTSLVRKTMPTIECSHFLDRSYRVTLSKASTIELAHNRTDVSTSISGFCKRLRHRIRSNMSFGGGFAVPPAKTYDEIYSFAAMMNRSVLQCNPNGVCSDS